MRVLLVVLALIAGIYANNNEMYKSEAFKGLKISTMRELEPRFIPDGQCSGLVSQLECPAPAVRALRVTVTDGEPYPRVVIDDRLATAEVHRARSPRTGRCEGEADVRVRTACAASPPRRTRRSPAPARLPPITHYSTYRTYWQY